ncbi:MAG TPA: hypothetical protein VJ937_00265 [Salinivirga sp.]|uniref:hypothetical protein n=1 Tax=Salinivirga sp. TaxID=1970192 RepID=UPI002B4901B2|nr:hypothetical protein [Salinivirga sp.]HKK57881.1 hypothetical protein [Salinivirga sp.]
MSTRAITLLILVVFLFGQLNAQKDKRSLDSLLLSQLTIDMQWFLAHKVGKSGGDDFNEFTLKRGYVNIKKGISEKLSGRITTDLTVDQEGDGKGDIEIRLKYLYLEYRLNSFLFFHQPHFEFGLVHRPWIDFEQSVNDYRVQGRMFLERNDMINSADFGVVFMSLLGGELDKAYQKNINDDFPGKYGSFSLGVFNGGGYHALENNTNKTLESRLTLRPLYRIMPGLQFTYHGAVGRGNTEAEPHWHYQSAYLSMETVYSVFTLEGYNGRGNYKGTAVQDTISYNAVPQSGYSVFAEGKFFNSKISLIGRYDDYISYYDTGNLRTQRFITGVAYHFSRGSKIIVDYERIRYRDNLASDDYFFELALELRF